MAKKQTTKAVEATEAPAGLQVEQWAPAKLKPYKRNAKLHPPEQVTMIANLIKRHGFDVPIVVDSKGVIIKGHGRWLAAKELAMESVPVLVRRDLTAAQAAEARIADNRVGEFGWDFEALVGDVVAGMQLGEGFDVNAIGWSLKDLGLEAREDGSLEQVGPPVEGGEVSTPEEENYSRKIEAPVYTPKEKKPPALSKLYDETKAHALLSDIEQAEAPEDVKAFLRSAALRHTVFNYEQIAEFYAHAPAEVQALMEKSALVIVDFKKAIENGFAVLTEEIAQLYREQQGEDAA